MSDSQDHRIRRILHLAAAHHGMGSTKLMTMAYLQSAVIAAVPEDCTLDIDIINQIVDQLLQELHDCIAPDGSYTPFVGHALDQLLEIIEKEVSDL